MKCCQRLFDSQIIFLFSSSFWPIKILKIFFISFLTSQTLLNVLLFAIDIFMTAPFSLSIKKNKIISNLINIPNKISSSNQMSEYKIFFYMNLASGNKNNKPYMRNAHRTICCTLFPSLHVHLLLSLFMNIRA